jgi:hypothetical protein
MKWRGAKVSRRPHSFAWTLAERFLADSRADIRNHRMVRQFQNPGCY